MHNLGIIGLSRGKKIIKIIEETKLNFKVVSILDLYEKNSTQYKNIKIHNNEKKFYKDSNFQSVYIASPVKYHATQTLKALKENKNILCEIPAFKKISQGYKIYKLLKKKKLIYGMAENYCYLPQIIALNKLIEKNFFGEITYIRSSYIHDCKKISYDKKNNRLTWRGEERKKISGNDYPTHSIGPVCKLLRKKSLYEIQTFSSKAKANQIFFAKKFSKIIFKRPDISLSHLYTRDKIMIDLICDTTSNRPSSMADLYIQGTKGTYISGRYDGEDGVISNSKENKFKKFNFKKYLTIKEMNKIKKIKKLYPMFKILENFKLTLDKKIKKPIVDFKDAFLWSSIIELSKVSLKNKKILKFKHLK